jgi:hypothetical protein
MSALSSDFVDKNSAWLFDHLVTQLDGIRANGGGCLQIPIATPLRTTATHHEYESEQKGKGAYNVTAELSCIWELAFRREGGHDVLLQSGNASTVVTLLARPDEPPPDDELIPGPEPAMLARWRMEVGDVHAPGCCFHGQISLGDTPPFPDDLPVPRFPFFVVTPMAALEFVLGELFQDRWPRTAARKTDQRADFWRSVQRRRWNTFLAWQQSVLAQSGGSPWPELKTYPDASLVF